MRATLRLAPALLLAGALHGQATEPSNPEPAHPEPVDPELAALIQDALAASPQLKAARAAVDVERAKVPQAGALPDPMLSLGYQNDGFRKFTYGESGFAFASLGASQTFPYPGKRKLRAQIAEAAVAAADAATDRVRLDLVPAVKRAYFDLLRVREQRTLLETQARLWSQVAQAARARLEAGTGSTADLIRVQLEQARLFQREADLDGRAAALQAELARLAGRKPDSSLAESTSLASLTLPALPDEPCAIRRVVDGSPELTEARHHLVHYQQQVDLAKLDLRPDFTVGAAVMPQGSMPGMWSLNIGFNVPLWPGRKQKQAVAEARAQARSEDFRITDLEQRLAALTRARLARLRADLQVASLYQDGLLAQSDAAYQAALSQFASGQAQFRQALEALSDRLKDRGDYLDALAQAHFDAIELERASLGADAPAAMNGGGQ